ncbi:NADH-quinone oxidoreductase subunit L [candidate division KSB1 bacterium]
MSNLPTLWLLIFFPFLGAVLNGFLGKKFDEKIISWIGCGAVGLSFILSCIFMLRIIAAPIGIERYAQELFIWIVVGEFVVKAGLLLDSLSAVMIMVVTGVGVVIHIYSVGYMHKDPGYARYFAYMNLFIFSMLLLVLADSFILMFVGWEGVGLCSYLLIGFWYEDKKNADAGKKAFIVNRIGDCGFLIGMLFIFSMFGSLDFETVFNFAPVIPAGDPILVVITLLLFIGAVGKSAQFPLYVWLPDAMQGPTPVSSLIHAATMVTAGIYMVVRCHVLFLLAPLTMNIIAGVGAFTAFFAASIGLVQNDIKRVLAYSTISQLGYMFIAVGVGAFSAGIFHLMTHAFFKGLLFLGAGSVIHGLSGMQDVRNMGGLRKYMPITYWTFFIAVLAITGIPGFSGFFSKDEILWSAFSGHYGNVILWLVGVVTAGLTAFYMFRLFYLTFLGSSRVESEKEKHIHESPRVMTIPLVILGFFSVIGGYIGIPHSLGGENRFEKFMEPIFRNSKFLLKQTSDLEHSLSLEYLMMFISIVVVFIGWGIVHQLYLKRADVPSKIAGTFSRTYSLLLNKYYVDEIYHSFIVNPFIKISDVFWKFFDVKIVDGLVNGTANVFRAAGERLRKIQTGYIQEYALSLILGAVIIIGYFIFK